jgi:hypothetical protein
MSVNGIAGPQQVWGIIVLSLRCGRAGRPSLHKLFWVSAHSYVIGLFQFYSVDQSALAVCGVGSTAFPDNVSQPRRDRSQKIR